MVTNKTAFNLCISLINTPKFAVDSMLGTISKKLRILGYDSTFSSNIEDEKLLVEAKNQGRIIVTKDVMLAQRAQKTGIDSILVTNNDETMQFIEIKKFLRIESFNISVEKSRCASCNGTLKTIEKKLVDGRVLDNVLKFTNNFWECISCQKVFWEGSHIKNLQKFFKAVNTLS